MIDKCNNFGRIAVKGMYRVARNKIRHQTVFNVSATGGLILKILEAV